MVKIKSRPSNCVYQNAGSENYSGTKIPRLVRAGSSPATRTKVMGVLMLWRVHPETVNLVLLGKHSWFESRNTHQS